VAPDCPPVTDGPPGVWWPADPSVFLYARVQPPGMASDSTVFGLSFAGVIAGLGVLIYGVTLTNGEHLNSLMLAGGVIVLLAFGLLTAGVARMDEPEGSGH